MTKEEFVQLTEEVKNQLEELQEEMVQAARFEHGYKSAGKRARKLARGLKNRALQEWINASVEMSR